LKERADAHGRYLSTADGMLVCRPSRTTGIAIVPVNTTS